MRKTFIISTILMLFGFTAFAQKGNNQVGIGLDLGLPMGNLGDMSNFGIGGTAKGMYGIGSAGQLELTAGYIGFGAKDKVESSSVSASATVGIIPIFVGYRHHLSQFYIEPQLGLAIISTKANVSINEEMPDIPGMPDIGSMASNAASSSTSQFGWALGVGYEFNAFDLSVRYQSASGNGGSLGFVGLRIGYNFSL